MTADLIYHIVGRERWERAVAEGAYDGDTLESEGFVHCSTRGQLAATAARWFAGRTDLLVLTINPLDLTSPVRLEPAPHSGELFPHVYGPIDMAAVVEAVALERVLAS